MTEESLLSGTWHFDLGETEGDALLHFTETGRAIQFMFSPQWAHPRVPAMRLWYSTESPGVIRLRPRPEHEGWTRTYKFEDEALLLRDKIKTWVCRKATPDQIPDWFSEALDAALKK